MSMDMRVDLCICTRIDTCTDMCHTPTQRYVRDTCIDMHEDMCIDMHEDMCIDMRIDMRIGMCIDMCVDMCLGMV